MPYRLAAVSFAFVASLAFAQTQPATRPADAGAVLVRAIDATGGVAAHRDVESQRLVGKLELPQMGMAGELTTLVAAPDKIRVTIELPGLGTFEQGATGGVGWANDPINGPRLMSEAETALLTRGLDPARLDDPAAEFASAEIAGTEAVDGEATTKLRLVTPEGHAIEEWYSNATGLLVKRSAEWRTDFGREEQTVTYDDYQPVGDTALLAPFTQRQNVGPTDVVVKVERTEANPDLPDDAFEPPAAVRDLMQE